MGKKISEFCIGVLKTSDFRCVAEPHASYLLALANARV